MAKRQAIKPSLRWSVFYRDGFACRYCGAQAGEDGIEIVVDHMLSVAEGGDNRFDNLITSCRGCNGGKGARSIQALPNSDEILARIKKRRDGIVKLSKHIRSVCDANDRLKDDVVTIKCQAYGVQEIRFDSTEITCVKRLLAEFGPEKVIEWYESAACNSVPELRAVRYVCGCARRTREKLV